jgi:4'-phosphopantetheinyl transferase
MIVTPKSELFLSWQNPDSSLHLDDGDVHVWRTSLTDHGSDSKLEALNEVLAPDEKQRASRYYFRRDRNRFVVARALARIILGRYIGVSPREIRFTYNLFGKPFLDGLSGVIRKLQFNVAHSHNAALIAVTGDRKIGIDVEWIRDDIDVSPIVERFFSQEEIGELRKSSRCDRRQTFYQYWTCKEAFVKAVGKGLSHSLSQVNLSAAMPHSPELATLSLAAPSQELRDCSILTFSPYLQYAAGLAVEGTIGELRGWNAVGLFN